MNDEYYMSLAINEAKKALKHNEVPIGAVLVIDDKVISKGYNVRESKYDPCGHAEIVAIQKACKKVKNWRLVNSTLYVTVEPCAMCAGAISWARIKRVVYGAPDLKGGALNDNFNLYSQKCLNHFPTVTKGVLLDECANLVKNFFKEKRNK